MVHTQSNSALYKKVFMALSIVLVLFMPWLSLKHGQSGDEWSLIIYGNDIYNYFFGDSTAALNYDGKSLQFEGLHYYGGLFDFTVTFLYKTVFHSITEELTFRHIVIAIIGALLFIYTGLLAKQVAGWRAGVLALIFIALSPRLLGEAMNNPKDIPFAFANVFFLYYLLRYINTFPEKQWKNIILMGVGFGMAMGFRIGGVLVIPYTVLFLAAYYFLNKDFKARINTNTSKTIMTIVKNFAVVFVLGYTIGIMFWPWALQEPLSRPLDALSEMTNRKIFIRMLFEGEYIMNTDVPWYYTLKWIFISNPVFVLLGFLTSLALIKHMVKKYRPEVIFVLIFSFAFPIFYAIYKHSTIYDTWRHFFFVYPNLVVLAALAIDYLFGKFAENKTYQYVITGVVVVGMALPFSWILRTYPNEYVYFNEIIGGVKNAVGVYDLDYYQNSGKQAAQWILTHAKPRKDKRIFVASNMSDYNRYFLSDTNWIGADYVRYNERNQTRDWDYYVTYSRYISVAALEKGLWPPANAVHVIKAGDVPISAVLERKNTYDLQAYAALQASKFDSAIYYYQKYIPTDPNNEDIYLNYAVALFSSNRAQEGLSALNKVIEIDPNNASAYDMLAKVYQAMGDMNRAQEAINKLNELSSQASQ